MTQKRDVTAHGQRRVVQHRCPSPLGERQADTHRQQRSPSPQVITQGNCPFYFIVAEEATP